jgi:heme-degrading monooxygenase HmoA
MATRPVVFSFFRYPVGGALYAFVIMGFQGVLLGRQTDGGPPRLMGCGSGDGFSILPDFRRYCLMTTLSDADDLDRWQRSLPYRRVARTSSEQLHFMLEPASGHGTWDGQPIFDYSGHRVGSRPFAVLTRAQVRPNRAAAFWRGVTGIRRQLQDTRGCAYHIGFGEHPLLTLATFSVWRDLEAMHAFAYRHSVHHSVSRAARAEEWLTESLFVRFKIRQITGDLHRYPKLIEMHAGRGASTGAKGLAPLPGHPVTSPVR